jgi:hypothetical protein
MNHLELEKQISELEKSVPGSVKHSHPKYTFYSSTLSGNIADIGIQFNVAHQDPESAELLASRAKVLYTRYLKIKLAQIKK